MITKPQPIKYYGGKHRLKRWINSLLPHDRDALYAEPFAGAGSLLCARPPARNEILNDLNGNVVNFHRMVRDQGPELGRLIEATPHSRVEFEAAAELLISGHGSALERALAFYCVQNYGMGGYGLTRKSSYGSHYSPNGSVGRWRAERVRRLQERLWNVQLECMDGVRLLQRLAEYDRAVIYVDPPYPGTDNSPYSYMPDYDALTAALAAQRGRVAVSGVTVNWDHLGWRRVSRVVTQPRRPDMNKRGTPAKTRTEYLWLNFPEAAA